jgi:atypical dual specificity phosphatase
LVLGAALSATTVALLPLEASAAIGSLALLGLVTLHHRLPVRILYELSVTDLLIREKFSRLFPRWVHQPWWHEITPRLYLGGIPLSSRGHLPSILKKNVNAVLAILEEPESMLETFFSQPVLESDWIKEGVAYRRISCPDMKALNPDDLNGAVKQLHDWIHEGKTVYVHCKAGRGRSAMVVVGYFMRYEGLPYETAVKKLRNIRSVVRFQPCQVEALREFRNCLEIK